MILHRTFLRFVVTIMLLSMVTMFGAAYMPASGSAAHQETAAIGVAVDMDLGKTFSSAVRSHDCDKERSDKFAGDDVLCATDCSYFIAPNLFAFGPSGQIFSISPVNMIWLGGTSSILKPPIV